MPTGTIRKIVQINEDLCDGCGLCVPSCAEGAIQIIEGKARLVSDTFCDGLGACLGECPQDAIKIVEREADAFDEEAVHKHLEEIGSAGPAPGVTQASPAPHFGGCPGSAMRDLREAAPDDAAESGEKVPSQLRQWPIQLHLVSPAAPYFQNADFALVADCVPFAYGDFHRELLKGKAIAIACPKLDDPQGYVDKLAELIRTANPKSITTAIMEVPCCYGLKALIDQAVAASGKDVKVETKVIGINGELKQTV